MSTIPISLVPVVKDFTPAIANPSFSTQTVEQLTFTTLGAGAQTLTAAEILGGFIAGTPTAAANYTTDTAANIVAAIPNAQVGSAIQFTLRNKAAGAYTITLVAGTGVTLNSGDTMTVAESNQKNFLVVVTALPNYQGIGATVTIYSMGTVVF
jgi:hypothetical protein